MICPGPSQKHCDLVRTFTILQMNFDFVNEFAISKVNLQSWKWVCNLGNEFAIFQMNLWSCKRIYNLAIWIRGQWLKNVNDQGSLIEIYILMCFKSFLHPTLLLLFKLFPLDSFFLVAQKATRRNLCRVYSAIFCMHTF